MIRTILLPLLAVAGLALAINTVRTSAQVRPANPPVAEPARSPFSSSVAGSGIIESSSENIAVGTPLAGTIARVHVKHGQQVKAGESLFELDSRALQAELVARQAVRAQAEARLQKAKLSPRAEDVPPLEARVKAAQARVRTATAQLSDAKNQLDLLEKITDKRAVVLEDLTRRRDAVFTAEAGVAEAEAGVAEAQSELNKMRAGTWSADLEIARADVLLATSQVDAISTDLERLIIRAPIDGQVLQRNVRPGEFAQAGTATSNPLVMIGNTDVLHIRCDIDENDAWRLEPGAKARASLRGNGDIATDVTFVRIEPYVVPKRSLTGESTERVDTRVLQVIFSFPKGAMQAYVGQLVDVRIEAKPGSSRAATPTSASTSTPTSTPTPENAAPTLPAAPASSRPQS